MLLQKNKRGFTLIELLVVISVIGFLSSIVLASLNTARVKAQDAERISDIHQIQNALELYRNKHDSYPVSSGSGCNPNGFCQDCGNVDELASGVLKPLIDEGDIPSIPKDPNPKNRLTDSCFTYEYFSQPQTFTGHQSPKDWGFGCDGNDLTNYAYVLRFSTEVNTYSFPKFRWQRGGFHEYCAVMNR